MNAPIDTSASAITPTGSAMFAIPVTGNSEGQSAEGAAEGVQAAVQAAAAVAPPKVAKPLGLLMTTAEAADLLRISVRQINRMVSAGLMPAKVEACGEQSQRFVTAEILDWIKEGCPPVIQKKGRRK